MDGSGNAYTTGYFIGTNANFDPDPSGSDPLSSSNFGSDPNAYVSKLSSSGQYVFGVDLGYGGTAEGQGIAVDSSGNVYTTGVFLGSGANFDPIFGDYVPLSSSSSGSASNAYVSKLTQFGQFVFAVDLGYGGSANGTGIALDGSGNVYTTGIFGGLRRPISIRQQQPPNHGSPVRQAEPITTRMFPN